MFKRILIANRGEIAIRIMRAARELGIETVAIYHEVDKNSPYVQFADYSLEIYGEQPKSAYLDIQQIIESAKKSKSEAIHPGYGFLSERAIFSQACQDNGIKFIGPSAFSIEAMGSKTQARSIMENAGVPIVPGSKTAIENVDDGIRFAEEVGYPILLKASAGGGGKGMRKVFSPNQFKDAFESAQREALKSFGDGSIYIEKLLENPKHIEFQIIADEYGNYVHLGERDCSIQRRHQKIIEEAPSTVLDNELRYRMGQVAINAAKAVNYVNAGTIEFLFDTYTRNFYFLEMNTRLQVEHPISESITGIDIVKEQIKIASGNRLSFGQEDIHLQGHSIECRINAEDPFNDFLPDTGKIIYLKEPAGKGVRLDSGLANGIDISIHFDPLLAKLISFGRNRLEAIEIMLRALNEYQIIGVKTGIPFLRAVLSHPVFRDGSYNTGFLENLFDMTRFRREMEKNNEIVSALASYFINSASTYQNTTSNPNGRREQSNWKQRLYQRRWR
ncbi:MAG: acetyl-CoA carboxylase biotin carboxylase subunit [Candidatus Kapaibacteriales bacterium]